MSGHLRKRVVVVEGTSVLGLGGYAPGELPVVVRIDVQQGPEIAGESEPPPPLSRERTCE